MAMRLVILGLAAALAGCGNFQPYVPDTARLGTGGIGTGFDPDVTAANQAAWAFADSGRTYGRPVEAARAAASLDYLAGQIYTSPRWSNVSAITKDQLLEGRSELRAALGVAPNATSQQVVDSLISAGNALAAGDRDAAARTLGAPVFPAGAQRTLAVLSNMPYLRMANVSTLQLENELFQNDSDIRL